MPDVLSLILGAVGVACLAVAGALVHPAIAWAIVGLALVRLATVPDEAPPRR